MGIECEVVDCVAVDGTGSIAMPEIVRTIEVAGLPT